MNNKKTIVWLLMGCISVIKAAFMALQNRLETIVKEVSMTVNRKRITIGKLLKVVMLSVCILLIFANTALAETPRSKSTDLLKKMIDPILDMLIYPILPAVATILIISAIISGNKIEVWGHSAFEIGIWVVVVEIVLLYFWDINALWAVFGGYSG